MRSRFALGLMAVVLIGGLVQILSQRVKSNDLLPKYSSLSTEPQGLRVLYDSLAATAAFPVSRSNQPPSLIKDAHATLVFAGLDLFNAGDDEAVADLEALARQGNRVLVTLTRGPNPFQKPRVIWDLHLSAMPGARDDEPKRWPAYFEANPKWNVIQTGQSRAVIIEREFGAGSIVLLAGTWPLTNEAMVRDPLTEMLAALFSGRPRVVFDESHLGMEEGGRVMALSRRFHLQGFLMGLALLAGLFVWRNISAFPPDRSIPIKPSGRDSLTGLSILLARNLSEERLLEICAAGRFLKTQGTTVEQFEAMRRQMHPRKRNL